MGQTWDTTRPQQPTRHLTRQPGLARDLLRAACIVTPAGAGILAMTAALARTGHAATLWLWLTALAITAAAVVAYGLTAPTAVTDRTLLLRRATHRWADRLQSAGHIMLWCAAGMFVVCVILRLVLTDTGVLAVASRTMPATPGGIGRESLNAGNAAQILDGLIVALPPVMILLITAGALRPPHLPVGQKHDR